ncbi:MAG: helix-hairpin-helix domain-containing protein [Erythrobacter sp.]
MPATLNEALPFILIAVVALIVLWFVIRAMNRKVTVVDKAEGDVLDEGAERAARNQALIDSPRSMEQKFGDTTAAANSDAVATAGAVADAEAGASVAASGLAAIQDVPQPAPVPEPAPASTRAPAAAGDDLTRIKGVGPKLVAILAEQGITSFAQIAAWVDEDVARIDAGLGRFQGRITRDQWVAQAQLLAAGDEAGFANKFGQNR